MVDDIHSKITTTILVSFIISIGAMAAPGKIKLSQNKMAELVIQNSLSLKQTDLKYEQFRFAPFLVYSNFDWIWSLESGYEVDKTESLSLIGDYRFERYKTVASISKSLLTGTKLTFDVARTSQKRDGDSTSTTTTTSSYDQLTYDSWGVRLEQALWGNSFGAADKAKVNSAEHLYKSQTLLRSDEIQNLVLDGLRLFWDAYVAQENFKEALGARDRYLKLVSSMQKKRSMGFTLPGEVSQVQAELEAREFTVKSTSQDYLRKLETLVTFLNLPTKSEVEFEIPKVIPPIPKLNPISPNQTRFIQSQELKIKSSEEDLKVSDSKNKPVLNLVARLGASGVDESPAESVSELTRGSHPVGYIGLKFAFSFGSDFFKEEYINKKAALEFEKIKQQRNLLEFEDRQRQSQRKVEVANQLLDSISKQKEFRERALTELNRSYTQGRTDIRNLIEAMNSYFNVELTHSRAIGDYFIALNEWAALRDELIKEEK